MVFEWGRNHSAYSPREAHHEVPHKRHLACKYVAGVLDVYWLSKPLTTRSNSGNMLEQMKTSDRGIFVQRGGLLVYLSDNLVL